jgi:hypothetical protein
MMLTRRNALFLLAAPAIVRAASLMPVRALAQMPLSTDVYVDVNWPGPQLGTRDNPWQSLRQAIAALDNPGNDIMTAHFPLGSHVTIHLSHGTDPGEPTKKPGLITEPGWVERTGSGKIV